MKHSASPSTGKISCAVAAALILGGCSGIVIYEDPGPQRAYWDGDFEYATHKGAIVTEIHGNPFPMPMDRFRDLVLVHMKDAAKGPPASFVATASQATVAPYKVVAVFNAATGSDTDDMCADGAAVPRTAPGPRARLDLVFCLGDQVKTEVAGTVSGLTGTADPKFPEFIRSVTHALIPSQDAEDTGDAGGVVP